MFTSFYWIGKEVQRVVFEAESVAAAYEEHDQLGPNAYDDRRLCPGDVSIEDEPNAPALCKYYAD